MNTDVEMLDFADESALVADKDIRPRGQHHISCEPVRHPLDGLHDDEQPNSNSSYDGTSLLQTSSSINDEKDNDNSNSEVIRRLEDVVDSLLSQVSSTVSSYQRTRATGNKILFEIVDRKKPLKPNGTFGTRTITFPHKSRHASAKPLAQFLRVVDLIHEALCSETPITKRDMYYKDVALFGSQSTVNTLVDDIAATMDVSRSDLYVRASAKGLFCGSSLVMHLHSGDVVRGNDSKGALIPPSEDVKRFDVDERLAWVLVVEKEAVFQTLCHLDFSRHASLPGPGLLITGKGYPDVATRQLVASLGQNLHHRHNATHGSCYYLLIRPLLYRIPILAVVDADPYGIDILSVYKFGSSSMSHQDNLDTPRIRWAGVMASELTGLGVSKENLIPITTHDEKKVNP